MNKTTIEWTNATWSPVTGCTQVSPGCDHCYAKRMAPRLRGRFGYPQDDPFRVTMHEDRLDEPQAWKNPRRIFVCSMGDLFHPAVPWEFIDRVFWAIMQTPQHTYQMLTKRPGRMAYYANGLERDWPSNVWAGTSVESAKYLPRLDVLGRVPARVRFVSAEPLLGPLDLRPWLTCNVCGKPQDTDAHNMDGHNYEAAVLNWCIVGGESGPGARPMHPQWAREIRDQCLEQKVAFFFKQASASHPGKERQLDGREWNEIPPVEVQADA